MYCTTNVIFIKQPPHPPHSTQRITIILFEEERVFYCVKEKLKGLNAFACKLGNKVLLLDKQTNQQTDNQPNKAMITVGVEEGGPEALHGHLGSDHRLLLPADSSSVVRV